MSELWERYGKTACIIFYAFALAMQMTTTFLIWNGRSLFWIMIIIQFLITTVFIFIAYKVANRVLLK
ncbi:hypothetical protein [Priestia megaterium]|uniref:hypothetical protein n=1 Tax=Priestia megaterium TaxID=1404 RepID=UPI00203E0190|nr:hypothetical protein [Priestia megaterium]MCM3546227.1 hypothetical protein [Priestia megaterium]